MTLGADAMRRISAMLLTLVLLLFCVYCAAFAEYAGAFSLFPDNPLRILIPACYAFLAECFPGGC